MAYYFAYGSNMDVERLEGERLNPEGIFSTSRCLGRLDGYRLLFNKPSAYFVGAGAANIELQHESYIFGTLNEMPETGLVVLDRYENVASRQYERVLVCVFNYDTNSFVEATAYISKERNDNRLRPRSGYMSHLLRGADVLPLGWIDYLKSIPTVVELA
jgi:gamma-glutamylcyclotransferase